MDPIHQPLKSLSAASLIALLKHEESTPSPDESPEARENRQRAAAELAMIFELNDSRAFQWFRQMFLDRPFRNAEAALKSQNTPVEELPKARTTYLALREIHAAVLEREIMHRELLAPHDDEIPRLRQRLDLL